MLFHTKFKLQTSTSKLKFGVEKSTSTKSTPVHAKFHQRCNVSLFSGEKPPNRRLTNRFIGVCPAGKTAGIWNQTDVY